MIRSNASQQAPKQGQAARVSARLTFKGIKAPTPVPNKATHTHVRTHTVKTSTFLIALISSCECV